MAPQHFAFLVLICALWGFNFVAAKAGSAELPPLLLVGLRFLVLAAVLWPFLRRPRGDWRPLALYALCMGPLHFSMMFAGLALTNASVMGLIAQLNIPIATLLSVLVLGEVVRWRRGLAIALSFLGVVVISIDPDLAVDPMALVLGFGAAATYAAGMVAVPRVKGMSALAMQAWIALLAAPTLLALSLLLEDGQGAAIAGASWVGWGAVAFTAIGASLVGHTGMTHLLQRYDVSLIGPLMLMTPVFAVGFAVLVLGEPVTARLFLGGAMVLTGALIILLRQGRRPGSRHADGTARGTGAGQDALGSPAQGPAAAEPAGERP